MTLTNLWDTARKAVKDTLDAFCDARDAHRGGAWERLSVAYPDPREARRALELVRTLRLQVAALDAPGVAAAPLPSAP